MVSIWPSSDKAPVSSVILGRQKQGHGDGMKFRRTVEDLQGGIGIIEKCNDGELRLQLVH